MMKEKLETDGQGREVGDKLEKDERMLLHGVHDKKMVHRPLNTSQNNNSDLDKDQRILSEFWLIFSWGKK